MYIKGTETSTKTKTPPRVAVNGQGDFCFFVAPFCSCPVSLVSRIFVCCRPRVCKVFLFVAPCWAPRPFGGARAKKHNTTQGVFFCSGPGERERPVGRRHGARAKTKTPPPAGAQRGAPSPAFRRGRS